MGRPFASCNSASARGSENQAQTLNGQRTEPEGPFRPSSQSFGDVNHAYKKWLASSADGLLRWPDPLKQVHRE